jgi:glycerol-1-phosphate dehydrogenase [NAD(P)+]
MPARDPIALLLAGEYPDPDTGEMLAAESRAVVIEDSLAGREAELVAELDLGRNVAVVSDRTTHDVLAGRVERALAGKFAVQSLVLDAGPRADEQTVTQVLEALAPTDLLISVGSGTLNDLGKMVAFRRDCAHAVFATAPSMNGYTSLSASITTSDGLKRSFRTRTPAGVYFDLRVLSAAPPRLIRAGLGDSSCRPTAQADWLLSHLLLDRPYREAPFALLAADERDVIGHTRELLAGDLEVMRHLVRTLVLSGFGMTICNGSYPASQGEHMLAHYLEMMQPADVPRAFHGEQIAVCAVAMATLQERMLEQNSPPVLAPDRTTRDDVIGHFGPLVGEGCWAELAQKRFDLDAVNLRLATRWDEIRARIGRVAVPAAEQRAALAGAGAPVAPAELGWSRELFARALVHAREIRNRYTFLDLALASRLTA